MSHAVINYEYTIKERAKKHVTLSLLHAEYVQDNPDNYYGYSRYCDLIREYCKANRLSLRQHDNPGEKAYLDFAGTPIPIYDPKTNKVDFEAQLFCAALGVSSYAFCKALRNQQMESWLYANAALLEFLGGVPKYLVPDNLKSGVTKADDFDPDINAEYANFAQHYGAIIFPARPKKPKDKPKVEKNVQIIEQRIVAGLRNQRFYSIEELNLKIAQLIAKINDKPYQKLEGSRSIVFEELDKPALQPLPSCHYQLGQFAKYKLANDYHICVDKHHYSVPYEYVGKRLDVRITLSTIEVFYRGTRITCHARSYNKNAQTTNKKHMPKAHLAVVEWDVASYKQWAASIGESTQIMMNLLLEKHDELVALRQARGLKSLVKKLSPNHLEKACAFAHKHGVYSFRFIKEVMMGHGIDTSEPPPQRKLPCNHQNIRGSGYFNTKSSKIAKILTLIGQFIRQGVGNA